MSGGHFFSRLMLVAVLIGAGAAPGLADPPLVSLGLSTAIIPIPPAAPIIPVAPAAPTATVHGVDSAAIAAALQGNAPLVLAGRTLDKATLAALYQPHGFQPIWTERREQSFLRALEDADSHGLDAGNYGVAATSPVARELLLTDAFLRYASALARGRVSPQDFETDWRIDPPDFAAAQVLDAAIAGDVSTVLAALAPHEAGYERLRAALLRYRALGRRTWHVLFSPSSIQPGDRAAIAPALRARLIAEGYLDPGNTPDDPTLFDAALSAAVAHFQTTHGLPVDGAVGRLTLAALNVSPALRVRQIRWNLERWRSLPRITAATRIEVNAAAAMATLYRDDQPVRVMRAIVGAAVHPTPVLRARISSVMLNPPWVVPSSIIEKEIRPMLKRDPDYLDRFGFAYQDVGGGTELVQRPGPTNALGQVKFEMPNPDDIYMHDTPERQLFALARRYVSHGCVRVEDPRGLARVLLDSDQWSRGAIDDAIATGQTQSVPLHRSLPVYVLYWTAFVDPDGTVEFRDDIYGRDRRLAEALAARAAAEHLAATEDQGPRG
ncbi:MAG TPA: L,D-transpeptidase family protein [Stellaceae bacterium]|nr:L,D-transpeptidase family protein [Stellaceae bacterium]